MGCKRAPVSANGPLPIICSPSTIARGTDGLPLTLDFNPTSGCAPPGKVLTVHRNPVSIRP
jgi:hypothetical protein